MEQTTNEVINSCISQNYQKMLKYVTATYGPNSTQWSDKKLRWFKHSQKEPDELLHEAFIRLKETIDDEKLQASDDTERYVIGCLYKQVEQIFLNTCKIEANRLRLSLRNPTHVTGRPGDPISELETADELSKLSKLERTIVKNLNMSVAELHRRFGDKMSYNTFKKRYLDKKQKIAEKLG